MYLYPNEPGANFSELPVVGDIDLDKYPLLEQVKPLRFCIEPGEMFYNTPGWWHTTRALTSSIAVVLGAASAPVWSRMRWEVCKAAFREHSWYKAPLAAAYYATYMTGFGIAQTIKDGLFGTLTPASRSIIEHENAVDEAAFSFRASAARRSGRCHRGRAMTARKKRILRRVGVAARGHGSGHAPANWTNAFLAAQLSSGPAFRHCPHRTGRGRCG